MNIDPEFYLEFLFENLHKFGFNFIYNYDTKYVY